MTKGDDCMQCYSCVTWFFTCISSSTSRSYASSLICCYSDDCRVMYTYYMHSTGSVMEMHQRRPCWNALSWRWGPLTSSATNTLKCVRFLSTRPTNIRYERTYIVLYCVLHWNTVTILIISCSSPFMSSQTVMPISWSWKVTNIMYNKIMHVNFVDWVGSNVYGWL